MKEINFNPRNKLVAGLDKVADAVKITIGPKGKNVILDRGYEPLITNDGGTIAQDIQLKDKIENMGAQIIKGVIRKTSEKVGGGRTASAILTQSIVHEGLKHIENGINVNFLKIGMQDAVKDISDILKKNAKEITTKEEIKQIATISTESEELGTVISDVIDKVGKDAIVTVEESQTFGITSEVVDGLKFDKGFISPFMVTNPERMEADYKDVSVLVTDRKISIFSELLPIIKNLVEVQKKNSLVLICEDFDGDALNNSVIMKLKGQFNLLAIKAPGFMDKMDWLEDIALSCNTKVASITTGVPLDTMGKAKKVLATKDYTIIEGTGDTKAKLEELKAQLENTESKYEKNTLEGRIARLSGSIAKIKVGAASETEKNYLKQKIEDGVNESKRALEEGIVIGGDCAFILALKNLKPKTGYEEALGYNIILKAISAPLKQIVLNSNGEGEVITNILYHHKLNTAGYDANTNLVIDDMFKSGIIDALKVTRTVLENAVSGAGMFLSIAVSISDEDDKKQNIEY